MSRQREEDRILEAVHVSKDDWRSLGIDSLSAIQDIRLRDGLSVFLDTEFAPEARETLELALDARASPQPEMPR